MTPPQTNEQNPPTQADAIAALMRMVRTMETATPTNVREAMANVNQSIATYNRYAGNATPEQIQAVEQAINVIPAAERQRALDNMRTSQEAFDLQAPENRHISPEEWRTGTTHFMEAMQRLVLPPAPASAPAVSVAPTIPQAATPDNTILPVPSVETMMIEPRPEILGRLSTLAPDGIVLLDRDALITLVNDPANSVLGGVHDLLNPTDREALNTRDGRAAVLARLGVTADTPDNYRLAIVNDASGMVALTGRVENGTFRGDRRLVISEDGNERPTLSRLFTQEFSPLRQQNQVISIPVGNVDQYDGINGIEVPRLTPEQQRDVTRQTNLLALVDRAMSGNVELAASNDRLPRVPGGRDSQVQL